MKLCYSCFGKFDDQFNVCPHCGQPYVVEPEQKIYLYPGSILNERYIIGEAIGAGGFGIIYKAWDMKHETMAAVKEYYPSKLVTRAPGIKDVIINNKSRDEFVYRKDRFLAEARTMAKYGSHRSIANVFEYFEENNTAYIVMELLQGEALNLYMNNHGKKLPVDFALMITNEVGNALKSLHDDGIIHRDVAPDNIFLCTGKEFKIKLLDLGAAKLADSTDEVIDIILKPGFSPYEQYVNTKNIGPWTDVYALGATLYQMLTGIKPDESTNRKTEDKVVPPHLLDPAIPENLSNAVMKAMSVDIHMRFKNVQDFLKAINGERKVKSLKQERRAKKLIRVAGIAAALLIAGAVAFYLKDDYEEKREVEFLEAAELSVWYCADKDSDEDVAMQEILKEFGESYPDISFKSECIPENEYAARLSEAADKNELPELFESTGVSKEVLDKARSVKPILSSDQAGECLFLDQYGDYYEDYKKLPLGIEVPMAFVITNGAVCLDYSDDYYKSLSDFGDKESLAVDMDHEELIVRNYGSFGWQDAALFMDNEENKAAVMLSTTMKINDVRETLTNYQKSYVYPKADKVYCNFTYEWSLGKGSKNEEKAADRLLAWMLGSVYQNTLMISRASEGQIPVNRTCYESKCSVKLLAPLSDEKIYKNFVFENASD